MKVYEVAIAFEGRRRGAIFLAEPSPRLNALVSGGYLKVNTSADDERMIAAAERKALRNAVADVASRSRTKKE